MSAAAKTYVFVNSAASTDNPSQFSVNIPEDAIKAKEGKQKLRLTLLQHSMVNAIPNIQQNHNAFQLRYNFGASLPTNNIGYTSTASSEQVGYENGKAFNLITSDAWRSAVGMYNLSTGTYVGPSFTTYNGVNYSGEHLSITFATPVSAIQYYMPSDTIGSPKSWAVFAHNNGPPFLLDQRSVATKRSSFYNITTPAGGCLVFWFVIQTIFDPSQTAGACTIGTTLFKTSNGTTIQYVIPPGTYTVSALTSKMNSVSAPIYVAHDAITNKLQITSQSMDDVSIAFTGHLGTITGFGNDYTALSNDQQPTWAPKQFIPCVINDLVLHLYETSANPPNNLANIANQDLQMSTIFGVIPLRAQPRALNVYQNLINAYQLDLMDSDPQRLGFRITDVFGAPIVDLPHWSAIIQCETVDEEGKDESNETLQGIMEYLRLIFVTKALSKSQRTEGNN